jgi:two-component system NtrC family sensor kinase
VLARDMQQAVRRKVIDTYPSALNADSLARFDELFVKYPDGSLRSPVERFGNGETVTGCIPRGTRLTEEFRQRIVLFHEILEQFKVSALLRFADIFITAPEQAMLGTDPPSLPQWCRVVAADFDLSGEIWEQLASRESNPTRGTFWSRIAFEPVWKNFLASVGTPIDVDGVHIGTIFNDLLLDDLVENLLRNGLPGAQQCIFQDDGYLIAHTARMPESSPHRVSSRCWGVVTQRLRRCLRRARRSLAHLPPLPSPATMPRAITITPSAASRGPAGTSPP